MTTNRVLVLACMLFGSLIYASADLEKAIAKTDLVSFKNLLPSVKLDVNKKAYLIEVAQEVVAMRRKMVEVYTLKSIDWRALDSYKKVFNKEFFEKISQEYISWGRWSKVAIASATFCILSYLGMNLGISMIQSAADQNAQAAGALITAGSIATYFTSALVELISLYKIVKGTREIESLTREGVQSSYADAVEIKRLLLGAPVIEA